MCDSKINRDRNSNEDGMTEFNTVAQGNASSTSAVVSPSPRTFHAWVDSATFSDGTILKFGENDIVVFVGPNNCGKSVSLQNLAASIQSVQGGSVIPVATLGKRGSSDELVSTLRERWPTNASGSPTFIVGMGAHQPIDRVKAAWRGSQGLREIAPFVSRLLTGDGRLHACNSNSVHITQGNLEHPIQYLYRFDQLEVRLSACFREAFGTDLILHRAAGSSLPLYCGNRPQFDRGEDRVSPSYVAKIEQFPQLATQGDGMKAFVGILLSTITLDYSIVLIDEPEAFLHPPQARLLGRMLAREKPESRQLFFATHSGDFLRGLLDGELPRVRVVRITRADNVNHVTELSVEMVKDVWKDPLLRYSNVLDGLFHQKVIVCEGDADCRFYGAMLDTIHDGKPGIARPDIMFTQGGGKNRIPTIVTALRNLGVPVAAILDFDALRDDALRRTFIALGGDWSAVESDCRIVTAAIENKKPEIDTTQLREEILAGLDAKGPQAVTGQQIEKIKASLARATPWGGAKLSGKSFLPAGQAYQAYERLEAKLSEVGCHIVGLGELERFDPSIGGHGPAWVNSALEKGASAAVFQTARDFVTKVIESV